MKIVIDNTVPFVASRIPDGVEVAVRRGGEITTALIKNADALVASTRLKVGKNLLEGSSVSLVATGSIGMDHIDVGWCQDNGIEAVNAPGCNAPAVVQYVVCALHSAGFDFSTQTLGIVGKGNIGGLLTKIVRKAGGRVVVCDPPRVRAGWADEDYLSLKELLTQADAVTFHVPKTLDSPHPTYHLLSPEKISFIKPGAIIVNAARGGIIDEAGLLQQTKKTSSLSAKSSPFTFIIDTWEGEPFVRMDLLERAFIATPHIAGYSEQGKQRAARSVIEALNRFLGLDIPTEGLADYDFLRNPPSLEQLLVSYDPNIDSRILKGAPANFEIIRNSYQYRSEAGF